MAVVGHKRWHTQILAHRIVMEMQTADDLCLRFRISRPVHAPVDASPSARRAADWVQGACVAEACAVDHQLGQTQLEQGMSVECSVSPARLLDGARQSVALTFSGSLRPDFSAHANDRGLVGRAGRFLWRLCGTRPRDHDRSPRLQHARVTIGSKPLHRCRAARPPVDAAPDQPAVCLLDRHEKTNHRHQEPEA